MIEAIKKHNLFNKQIILGIRTEHINDNDAKFAEYNNSILDLTVDVAELLGASTNIYTTVSGSNICAVVDPRIDLKIGDKVKLGLDLSKAHIFDAETEICLTSKFYNFEEAQAKKEAYQKTLIERQLKEESERKLAEEKAALKLAKKKNKKRI